MTFPVFPGSNPSGYNLTRSLRFRSSASAYLNRTQSAGNQTTWTFSAWIKLGLTGGSYIIHAGGSSGSGVYYDASAEELQIDIGNGTTQYYARTSASFRDFSAWYHVVCVADTSNATSTNRLKVYVNGVLQTIGVSSYPTSGFAGTMCQNATATNIGKFGGGSSAYYDGYLADVYLIDGQALTPSSFGSTNTLTGVWQPARYTGTYGTNGFYLPFTDNSALTTSSNVGLGKDFSGNGNYWTTNNISITAGVTYDSMTDVPTLTSATAANFAVMNPLNNSAGTSWNIASFQAANLNVGSAADNQNKIAVATMAMTTGKFYWEVTIGSNFPSTSTFLGMTQSTATGITKSVGIYYINSGQKNINGTSSAYGASYTTGDVVGFAYDADAGVLTCYKNNSSQGAIYSSGVGSSWMPTMAADNAGAGVTYYNSFNFGQRPFTYTPPTGFVALNTFNLPTSTIVKGNTVMDATLYTGTLLSNAVTNAASFKPDLVWLKSRSAATDNKLTDSVRGVTKALVSNSSAAETTDTQGLTAFGSAGFTVGTNTDYNNLTGSYVGWQWQAGQGTTSTNTSGTITSSVSVNASAGFSVVKFNNATSGSSFTFGHGLGVAPALVIFKYTDAASNWYVYHQSTGNTGLTFLDTTGAFSANSTYLNNTSPTSSVVTLGSSYVFGTVYNLIAYCWTPIAGYSSFGSYTGNGSTDGPFVYLGFRPRFILYKASNNSTNWVMLDTARDPYNVAGNYLFPNSSSAEGNVPIFDIVSNGFKVRTAGGGTNGSGDNIVYMAFAENPFKNALAR